ncbi:MAG: pSer/pThr/pTyr-binding forkhead associated (FHA) protein, partial [Planctomycetota bacterium]
MSNWVFQISEPGKSPKSIDVAEGITFGRNPSSRCVLEDGKVSGNHAAIEMVEGKLAIVDVGSTNKTKIAGGAELGKGESEILRVGLKLHIGDTEIEVVNPEQFEGTLICADGDDDVDVGETVTPEDVKRLEAAEMAKAAETAAAAKKAAEAEAAEEKKAVEEKAAADKKAAEAKAAEAKAAEAKAAEAKAAENKVATDAKAAKVKIEKDKQSADAKVAEEKKAADAKPAESKPAPAKESLSPQVSAEESASVEAALSSNRTLGPGDSGMQGLVVTAFLEAARPRLVLDSPDLRRIVEMTTPEFKIGRQRDKDRPNPNLQLGIPHERVSGEHARITTDGEYFWIEDLKSLNRTFVNEEPLAPHAPKRLKSDVEISFGPVSALFVASKDGASSDNLGRVYTLAADLVVRDGKVGKSQLEEARKEQREIAIEGSEHHIGEVLIKRGIINVKDWIQYVERARLQVGMGGGKTTGSKLGLP